MKNAAVLVIVTAVGEAAFWAGYGYGRGSIGPLFVAIILGVGALLSMTYLLLEVFDA
jgi:hypothetical protein